MYGDDELRRILQKMSFKDLNFMIDNNDRSEQFRIKRLSELNDAYICPHCQTKGCVRTKSITKKMGISGAKATGALFTGGLSLLATGLSRKEGMTQAHCCNCNCTWDF
jgi:hypothetical protein